MKMTLAFLAVFSTVTGLSLAGLPSKADLLRRDGNHNGALDVSELGQLSDDQRESALKAYDSNRDGEIAASELEAGPKKEEADKDDKDGKDGKKGKKKGGKKGGKKGDNKADNKGGNKGGGGGGGGGNGNKPAMRKAGK